jgi:hypothetical protein
MLAYGKGRGEAAAALNFGDLFAYALARQLRPPLLFKGEDFLATGSRCRRSRRKSRTRWRFHGSQPSAPASSGVGEGSHAGGGTAILSG